jgi:PAS domain S-box-containing protein
MSLQEGDEQSFRLILEMIPGLVYTMAPTGELEFCSQQILDYYRTTLEELRNWTPTVHPDDVDQIAEFRRCIAAGEPLNVVLRGRRHDGVYVWFHSRAVPLKRDGQIVRWYGLMTDITELKHAEERLRRSEAFLLEAQRLSRAGSWRYDLTTGKVTCSPEMLRVFAVQPDEDSSMRDFWLMRIHPEDRQRVRDVFDKAERERTEYQADFRAVLPDGTIRHMHASGHPVVNAKRELVEFLGTVIDTTEREVLRTTKARLAQAMQITTVGELAASIAHEVNQPLAAIVANAHAGLRWLSAEPPNLSQAREAAERIVRDGKHAGDVMRHVRSLFRRADVERLPLDVNEVIREVLRLIERDLERRGATVSTDLDTRLPLIMADRVQLQQLALNLIKNALDAMDSVVDRPRTLFIRSRRQDDHFAVVEVRDLGIGMKEPERAFEAFFTTKAGGMGVGLAICRSIVEAHDGKIWIAPSDGVGTTICFTLPLQPTVTP